MSTRVFVRLYDGATQHETEDEVMELPPAPLKWKDVITAMVTAVGKQNEYEDGVTTPKARLFLLPTEAGGITGELNARALRFGVRENDRFVICLQGEDYQPPSERLASPSVLVASTTIAVAATGESAARPMTLSPPSANSAMEQPTMSPFANVQTVTQSSLPPSGGPPRGGIGAGAPSGGLMSSGKKGNKRYRSISGKMAAIKSLSDKGLISNDDRGHLKDLLLNSDSPQLQEALDKYNNTGDFQAVKDLLLKEVQNPSSKRNTGDWLSESFVNDITLNFNTTPPAAKPEQMPMQNLNSMNRFNATSTSMTPSSNTYGYQSATHSTPMNMSGGYPQNSPMAMNQYSGPTNLVTPTGGNMSNGNGYPTQIPVSASYQTTILMQQQYHQPQASPTNMYGGAPQINLPLRDRATYLKRGYESSPVHNVMGMNPPVVSPADSAQLSMNAYGMQQGYVMNQGSYPANVIYAGDQTQYVMNPYMSSPNGGYNPYQQQQQPQYAMNRYGYGSMQPDMGYNFYAAGYGFGKAQLRAGPGGKWTTAPPMPSYPPPCSKEEKKEKIAKWLKKRETRNWSNKPSYPVRHSIAKNRKRGEDGRFITKKRLAEMAAEEAAAAATGMSDEPQQASPPSSTAGEAPVSLVSQTSMPQATPVP